MMMKLRVALNQTVSNSRFIKKIIIILLALFVAAITTSFGFGIKKAHGASVAKELNEDHQWNDNDDDDNIGTLKEMIKDFRKGKANKRLTKKGQGGGKALTDLKGSGAGVKKDYDKTCGFCGAEKVTKKKEERAKNKKAQVVADEKSIFVCGYSDYLDNGGKTETTKTSDVEKKLEDASKIISDLNQKAQDSEKKMAELKGEIEALKHDREETLKTIVELDERLKWMVIGTMTQVIELGLDDPAKARDKVNADLEKVKENIKAKQSELVEKRKVYDALGVQIQTLEGNLKNVGEDAVKKAEFQKSLADARKKVEEIALSVQKMVPEMEALAAKDRFLSAIKSALDRRLTLVQETPPVAGQPTLPQGDPREGQPTAVPRSTKTVEEMHRNIQLIAAKGHLGLEEIQRRTLARGAGKGDTQGGFSPTDGTTGSRGSGRGRREITVMDNGIPALLRAGE